MMSAIFLLLWLISAMAATALLTTFPALLGLSTGVGGQLIGLAGIVGVSA